MKKALSIASVLLLCTSASLASSVKARFTGVVDRKAVHLKDGASSHYVYSGKSKFKVLDKIDDGSMSGELAAMPAVGEHFYGYCIDFSETINSGWTRTWTLAPLSAAPVPGTPMSARQVGMISYLYDSFAPLGPQAELQLAMWEVLQEDEANPLSILDHDFRAPRTGEYNEVAVQAWLATLNALDDGTFFEQSYQPDQNLFALVHDGTQDFMIGVPLDNPGPPDDPAIPEPMTMLSGLMGCGAVARYLRRRRRA
jgi:hypothetical protein